MALDLTKEKSIIDGYKTLDEHSSIEEIDDAIERLTKVSADMNNLQLGVKIYINSVYGATASPYFVGYNVQVAEAITLQGQDVIHFASQSMEDYFTKLWPIDKKAHKALGVKKPATVNDKVTIYGDTDTVQKDCIVKSNKGEMTIEELFENEIKSSSYLEITQTGNEVLHVNDLLLENFNSSGEIEMSKVKYLIRHKIEKPKYKIKTKSGKEIIVTNDHSCIVFRNGQKMKVKACEILPTDKILVIKNRETVKTEFDIEGVESVECIGNFDKSEYAYDVEMDDDTHTFIANDILVHNSCYITFQEPIYNSEYEDGDNHIAPLDFVTTLYKVRLEDYLNHQFEKYAEPWNTKNLQNFELETISKTMILLAKKHYVGDKVYSDGIISDSLSHIKLTGVEVVQSSTPAFARVELLEIIKLFLKDGKKLDYRKFVNYLKDLKKRFMSTNIADISFGSAISDLEKGVMLEHDNEGYTIMKVNSHCPVHVRGAGYHNVLLSNSEYKKKYNLIKSGDKVKYYYVKDDTQEKPVFSFLPGNFPYEYAPEVDYDLMFEKVFVVPINRFLEPMGFNPIPSNLVVTKSLF